MNMEEGKNASDRELFSELFENPIHPLFIHMVPPFVDENDRMFRLQVSGEALWKWKDVCKAGTLFELLQASILPLGYQLHDSACERVGDVVARSVRRFREKLQSSTNGKKKKKIEGGDLDQTRNKSGGDNPRCLYIFEHKRSRPSMVFKLFQMR